MTGPARAQPRGARGQAYLVFHREVLASRLLLLLHSTGRGGKRTL